MMNANWFLRTAMALPVAALAACGGSSNGVDTGGDSSTGPAAIAPGQESSAQNAGQISTGDTCPSDPTQVAMSFVDSAVVLPVDPGDLPVLGDILGTEILPDLPILTGVVEGDPTALSPDTALLLLDGTPLGTLPVIGEIRALCAPLGTDLTGIDPTAVIALIPVFDDDLGGFVPTGLLLVTIDDLASGPITGLELPADPGELDAILGDLGGLLQSLLGDLLSLLGIL